MGVIEETIKWRRRGLDDPWLPDSFMAELSQETIQRLECHGRVRSDVDAIVTSGDDAPVLVVLNRAVKVYRQHWGGKRSLVHIAGHGDVLGAEPVLTSKDVPVSAVFHGDRFTQVLAVPRARFRYLVEHDDEIGRAVAKCLARRSQEQDAWLGHIGRTVDKRVWAYLVGLARRLGVPFRNATHLDIGLTQADIADALGVATSSVEDAMRKLRVAGRLETHRSAVVLYSLPSELELDRD